MATLGSTCLRREAEGCRVWPICGQRENKVPRLESLESSTPLLRGASAPFISQGLAALLSPPVHLSPRTQDRSQDDYSLSPLRCEPACCELSKMRTCAPGHHRALLEAPHPGMWSFLLGFAASDLTGFISPLHLDLPAFIYLFFKFIHP